MKLDDFEESATPASAVTIVASKEAAGAHGAADPVKRFANALQAADEVVKREFGIPVEDFDITLSLDVKARWVKGYPGNREEPPEPAGYRIEKVMCGATDITAIFSEEDLERLAIEMLD